MELAGKIQVHPKTIVVCNCVNRMETICRKIACFLLCAGYYLSKNYVLIVSFYWNIKKVKIVYFSIKNHDGNIKTAMTTNIPLLCPRSLQC